MYQCLVGFHSLSEAGKFCPNNLTFRQNFPASEKELEGERHIGILYTSHPSIPSGKFESSVAIRCNCDRVFEVCIRNRDLQSTDYISVLRRLLFQL